MTGHGLDLAVIGNGRTAALVDPTARIVWWCYPRFDGDPIFCRLLAGKQEKGFSDVVLDGMAEFQSEYMRNTAIVSTVLTDRNGGKVQITDFVPRFRQFGRVFRPPQLYRIVEPVAGLPRITIRMRPASDYGKPLTNHSLGSNHIRYSAEATVIRLTTDAPLSLIESEAPFVLTRPVHLVFGPDEPFQGDLSSTCREFAERTHDYWVEWVRRLSISVDWQEAIIRAAITLKLSNFDETGAVIAAHTTSIPEAPGSGRTWDYRYCWLRDAYFVVQALNRIGATRTMEEFISFTLSIVSKPDQELRPLYSVVPTTHVEERTAPDLEGYLGDGPVRVGNAAVGQAQHDTYGSVILAAMPMFFDRRSSRTPASGNTAGGSASIPIRRRCAGRAVRGSRPSPCGLASRSARSTGMPSPSRSTPRSSPAPGTRSAVPSPRRSAPTTSTPACCCSPTSASSRSTIRASSRPSPRWSASWCARST